LAGFRDSPQEFRVVLHTVVEAVVFASEADQDPGGLSMARDDDFFFLREAQRPST